MSAVGHRGRRWGEAIAEMATAPLRHERWATILGNGDDIAHVPADGSQFTTEVEVRYAYPGQ